MPALGRGTDPRKKHDQQQRAKTLAETHGGHDGPTGFTTDFASDGAGGLLGLRAMIEHAQPSVLDTIAQHWTTVNAALLSAQTDLEKHTTEALGHWEGDAAEGFATRADQLYQSLGNGAAYAFNASSGVSTAADALRTAKATMPTVPGTFDRASRKLTSETNDHQFKQDLSSGMSRAAAIKLDGGQLSLMEERHQQAIVVMQQLEGSYTSAATMIGKPPPADVGGHTVYPPPVATKHVPVTGSDGGKVAGPRTGGKLTLVDGQEAKRTGPTGAVDPHSDGSGTTVGGGGSNSGITGGEQSPAPDAPGTTLSGVHDGIHSTTGGTGTGIGLSGPGSVSGVGSQGGADGFGGAGEHGIAGGMRLGAGGRAERAETGGLAGSDLAGDIGAHGIAGTAESEVTAAGEGFIEEGAEARTRAGEAGSSEGGGMGMGGVGGANKKGKKRKRRARAHYLVEDEESWETGTDVNPAVIG